jgi:membrane protein DedA with SNARE-associated domain/rhodanese-related sulfurtransferase
MRRIPEIAGNYRRTARGNDTHEAFGARRNLGFISWIRFRVCDDLVLTCMDALLSALTQHGLSILFAAVFLEAIGIPVPAALALIFAGAASARGALPAGWALLGALSAMMLGDAGLFLVGRYTGWWLLGMLCRISLNPDSCILRSADTFYRRGRKLLVFAKFVPGINTMAPPLAGSMNMRPAQFFRLDLAGASLYVGTYFTVGFLFSGAIEAITGAFRTFGQVLDMVLLAAAVGYFGFQVWAWLKARAPSGVPYITPADVAADAVIYDVRSHGYYDPKAIRIRGSRRLEPNGLPGLDESAAQVYLYCTCIRDATSVRVANALLKRGMTCAVIQGGLRAWRKAGLPTEAVPAEELVALPGFD